MATDDPLWDALRSAHGRLAPGVDRFPAQAPWEPQSYPAGTDKSKHDQEVERSVPRVPEVPSQNEYQWTCGTNPAAADLGSDWEERCAILEFDGGLSRQEAERYASDELRG